MSDADVTDNCACNSACVERMHVQAYAATSPPADPAVKHRPYCQFYSTSGHGLHGLPTARYIRLLLKYNDCLLPVEAHRSVVVRVSISSTQTQPNPTSPNPISYRYPVVTESRTRAVFEITGLKDIGVTTLTLHGHVTSSMTSSFDLPHAISC